MLNPGWQTPITPAQREAATGEPVQHVTVIAKWRPDSASRSASHVQDGIRVGRLPLQEFDGACCRHDDQLDLAALGFTLHLVHHGESTGARTDDQPATIPRYLLLDGQRRMPELGAELLRGLLLALADLAMVDHHVVFIGNAIDLNGSE